MSKYHIVGNPMSRLVDHVDRPDKMDDLDHQPLSSNWHRLVLNPPGEVIQSRATIGLSAKRHSLVFSWRADSGPLVYAGCGGALNFTLVLDEENFISYPTRPIHIL